MNVTVKSLPKNQAELYVEVEPAEAQPHLARAAQRLAARLKIPGFRPGKAPYEIVAKQVGEQNIWEEALESIVSNTFLKAIQDHKLTTVGQPSVNIEKLAPGNPVIYRATVSIMPEVSLAPYQDLKIERQLAPVTEEEVTKAVDELRSMMAMEKPVDRPAQNGDVAEVDIVVSVDGVAIEGGTTKNQPIILGSHSYIPGFEEQLVGVTKGVSKEFVLPFPKEYHAQNLQGKNGKFKVTVNAIKERKLPELNDAFAERMAKLKTVEELKDRFRKNLEEEHALKTEREFEVAILDELVKRSKFGEIPEVLIENEINRMLEELKHDIHHRGMKYEDYLSSMKKDEKTLRTELQPAALNRLKSTLVIRGIAIAENVTVNETDIDAEIAKAQERAQNEKEVEQLSGEDFRRYTETMMINRKALEAVKAKVVPAASAE